MYFLCKGCIKSCQKTCECADDLCNGACKSLNKCFSKPFSLCSCLVFSFFLLPSIIALMVYIGDLEAVKFSNLIIFR